MIKPAPRLPQIDGDIFLTDSGLETTLLFREGYELPYFAAFHLLKDAKGEQVLRDYYRRHAAIARENNTGFILEAATWRANPDWGNKLGYSPQALDDANRHAVDFLRDVKNEFETARSPMVISGCVGPRGDAYQAGDFATPQDAQTYHARQIGVFAQCDVDLVTAMTLTSTNEAIGIVRAAQAAGLPAVISFTLETDGRLPSGESLRHAIETVDRASANGPAYYMINCAHPSHFEQVLDGGAWMQRLRGIRANASTLSHAQLDESTTLDDGDPVLLGEQYGNLYRRFRHINVLGGCCGTDHRHIEQICKYCKGV